MDDQYLISIILRARDEFTGVVQNARREIGQLVGENQNLQRSSEASSTSTDRQTQATQRSAEATKQATAASKQQREEGEKLHRQVKDLTVRYNELSGAQARLRNNFRNSIIDAGEYVDELKKVQRELRKVADESDIGDDVGRQWGQLARRVKAEIDSIASAEKKRAQEYRQLAREIVKEREAAAKAAAAAEREVQRAQQKTAREQEQAAQRYARARSKQIEADRKFREHIRDTMMDFADFQDRMADMDRQGQAIGLQRFARDFDSIARGFRSGSREAQNFGRRAEEVRDRVRELRSDSDDGSNAILRLHDRVHSLQSRMAAGSQNVAALSARLRGLIIYGIITFAQQLSSVVVGLGGHLISLASSAAMAGAALGGALAAGAAQALPVIGLLAAAVFRASKVMEALQQSNLLAEQTGSKVAQTQNRQANASDALANALDTLASAQEAVRDAQDQEVEAQQRLIEARSEAVRQLEDMIMAEKRAELAARGAALSQAEAQDALRASITAGQTGTEFGRSRLDVADARLDRRQTSIDLRRQRADTREARRDGVEGSDRVQDARKALKDAQEDVVKAERAVERARRGIERARRGADMAGADMTAAAGKLNYLLEQLSPAERKLYAALKRVQDNFRTTFQPITDLIIRSFTRTVNRVDVIMGRVARWEQVRRLASEIGRAIDRMTRGFTDSRSMGFFARMINEAAINMRPLTRAATNLWRVFMNIADGAAPTLRRMFRDFAGWTGTLEKGTRDTKKLNEFFEDGYKHLKAWLGLFGAIFGLFGALIGASSGEGKRSVDDMTDSINRATRYINNNRREVREFFRDSREVFESVGSVLFELGKIMVRTFRSDYVQNLAHFFVRVLLPAFELAAVMLGAITNLLMRVGSVAPVSEFLKWAIALMMVYRVGSMVGIMLIGLATRLLAIARFLYMAGILSKMAVAFRLVGTAVMFLGRAFVAAFITNPVGLAIAAIVAAIILLDRKFHFLKPTIKWLREALGNVFNWIKRNWDLLTPILLGPFGAFIIAYRRIKPFREAIQSIFNWIKRNWDLLTPVLLGPFGIFIILFRRVSGFRNAIIGVFNWIRRNWDLLTPILLGPFGFIVIAIRRFNRLKGVFEDVKDAAGSAFGWIGDKIESSFNWAVGKAKDAINWLIDNVINRIPGVEIDNISESPPRASGTGLRGSGRAREGRGFRTGGYVDQPQRFGIGGAVRAIRNVAGGGLGLAKDLFGNLGGIMDRVPDWMQGIARFIASKVRDLIVDKIPGAGTLKGVLNKIGLQTGGRVGGPAGQIDTISALLSPGEFVVTPHGEALLESLTGVPGILEWLASNQRPVGYQTGGRVQRFAEGGRVQRRDARQAPADSEQMAGMLEELQKVSKEMQEVWGENWDKLVSEARRGSRLIRSITRDMNQDVSAEFRRMARNADRELRELVRDGQRHGRSLERSIVSTMREVSDAVYTGFTYVKDATNVALKSFDVDPVKLNVPRPKGLKSEERAIGGFVGNRGERGKDEVMVKLGRGELVLNWQQQAALAAQGVDLDSISKFRGYHAGGPEQPGFAAGGRVDIKGALPGFVPFMQYIRKMFGPMIYVMSGLRPGSRVAGSGRLSNHASGQALDITHRGGEHAGPGNPMRGAMGERMDKLHRFLGRYVPSPPRLDFLWRTMTGGNHFNHIHIGISRAVSGSVQAMKRFLSKLPEGGIFEDIPKILVKGTEGRMRGLAQKAIDRVRKAGSDYIESNMPDIGGPADFDPHAGGVASREQVTKWFTEALRISGNWPVAKGNPRDARQALRNLISLAHEESTWNPNAQNRTAAGRAAGNPMGILQVIPATFNRYKMRGHNNIFNPVDNAIASIRYQIARYGGINRAHAPYAEGGEIPGTEGSGVPILAHAGEWVLNRKQQMKLARAVGINTDRLKEILGFQRRVTDSFDEGGEVSAEIERRRAARAGTYRLPAGELISRLIGPMLREADRAVGAVRRVLIESRQAGKKGAEAWEKLADNLDELTKENGVFDILKANFERFTARIGRKLQEATYKINRTTGEVVRMLDDTEIAERELANLRRTNTQINEQRDRVIRAHKAARGDMDAIRRQITRIERGGIEKDEKDRYEELIKRRERMTAILNNIEDRRNELDQQRLENEAAIYEAQTAVLQRQVEESNRNVETAERNVDRIRRIGELTGDIASLPGALWDQLEAMRQRGAELWGQIAAAKEMGNDDLARDLTNQLQEISVAIEEFAASRFSTLSEAITNATERSMGRLDVQSRMMDAIGAVGMGASALAQRMGLPTRGEIFGRRGDLLTEQRSQLAGLLREAQNEGNIAAITNLTDQINELDVTIRENTRAYFTARLEDINNRASYANTITDLNKRIIELGGELSGTVDQAALLVLANERTATLQNQRRELEQMLAEAQSEQDQQAINDLAQQLLENQVALLENTQAINELNGQMTTQSFTSTGWQWFRNAVFTGSGGLLPQYQIPGMDTGGQIVRDGLVYGHAGEIIKPATITRILPNDTGNMDLDINVTEQVQEADPQVIADRVAFRWKNRG